MSGLPVWIGIDDTDSYYGGCTTWIAAKLASRFKDRLLDFPYLVRLNPEIPWKTRGNGALAIKLSSLTDKELEEVAAFVMATAREEGKTSPSLLISWGDEKQDRFAIKAVRDVITKRELERVLEKIGPTSRYFLKKPGKPRGLIGCIAAINHQWSDATYELIAYRDDQSYGRPEFRDDVLWMDSLTAPVTFANFDREAGKPLIYPHGPDPVLFGIRGEDPRVLKAGMAMIENSSSLWMVFKTNQGTDEHVITVNSFEQAYPYTTISIEAHVLSDPTIIPGGHVVIELIDKDGNPGQVIFYRQTGNLNRVARKLVRGDFVRVWGGVRPEVQRKIINGQGLVLITPRITYDEIPSCPFCHRKMREVNAGRYICDTCKVQAIGRARLQLKRDILPNRIYQPSASAFKHLMKPAGRRPIQTAQGIGSILS
ncbi:tRNA(Ile)(2)-agmatinylcytidine synthase [Tardisphaera miroshnichenkoae]